MDKFSFKRCPVNSEGVAFDTLEAFQASELKKLFPNVTLGQCEEIVARKHEVQEILEITMNARPAARGGKKPRKPKPAPAQQDIPGVVQSSVAA